VLIKIFARPGDVAARESHPWRPQGRIREGWGA